MDSNIFSGMYPREKITFINKCMWCDFNREYPLGLERVFDRDLDKVADKTLQEYIRLRDLSVSLTGHNVVRFNHLDRPYLPEYLLEGDKNV